MQVFRALPEWVKLEHEVAKLLTKQELHGWYFDEQAAWKLASTLRTELVWYPFWLFSYDSSAYQRES